MEVAHSQHDDRNKTVTVPPLPVYVKQTVEQYFALLAGHDAVNLHAVIMNEVEKVLLETTLIQFNYNQTKAAKALGLSRSTLRKKLAQYGIH